MRRKATAPERRAQGNALINAKAREKTPLTLVKQTGRATKTPAGKGLGKAGAKRLGRLLKRAIQVQEEPAGRGPAPLPKTPVRLFKHRIQTEADNGTKTNAAQARPASHHVSKLILSVVSQCKHRGSISMAELKQTLAAEGYDVTKNNRRVNVVTRRLINNETLVRTTRNGLFRLNSKKQTDTTHVRTSSVKSPKPKEDLKQSKTARKSPRGAEKSQRRAVTTHKPRGKPRKPNPKASRRAARSHKPRGSARKPARKTQKPTGRTRKPAGDRSHKSRWKASKARRKSPKAAEKKRRSPTSQAARARKARRKPQRTRRRQPGRSQQPYKSSQKPRRRRLPKTRSRTRQRQIVRRRRYYYY